MSLYFGIGVFISLKYNNKGWIFNLQNVSKLFKRNCKRKWFSKVPLAICYCVWLKWGYELCILVVEGFFILKKAKTIMKQQYQPNRMSVIPDNHTPKQTPRTHISRSYNNVYYKLFNVDQNSYNLTWILCGFFNVF